MKVPAVPGFRLTRYFSVASLLGILAVLAVLLLFYRHFALSALTDHETRGNTALARVFANTIWPNHAAYVKSASAIPKAELAQRPEIDPLRQDVLRQMAGLNVVKVKIYNLDGLTVFSTDPKQIGEDKGTNGGFLNAKAGATVSEITFRNSFDAFEQVINDRNLVSSYIPISKSRNSPVEGVMEVYSDVTDFITKLEKTQWQIVGGVLGSLSLLYLFLLTIVHRADNVIRAQAEEMRLTNKSLEQLSLQDGLTNLANRRFFDKYLADQMAVARRHKRTLALIMCDIDTFKAYNDRYGHQAGDECLKRIAAALRSCCRRPADMVARYGGEEFAMILPDTELIGATRVAEAARAAVAELNIPHEHSPAAPYVSISGGVAVLLIDMTPQQLIAAADQTLYQAKHLGRNRMVSVQAEPGVTVFLAPATGT